MKLIFTLFLLIGSLSSFSQTSYFSVNETGRLDKIVKVSAGGYITSGYDSNYKHQYIRWDDNFNPLWKIKLMDAGFAPFSNYVIEANDGSFFISAMSNNNSGSFFVMKLSSTGTVMWQKFYSAPGTGNSLSSLCLSKAAGSDNGFIFGTGNCTLSNCIVKCDAAGNIEWQKQYIYPLAAGVITCWTILPDGNNYIVCSGFNIKSLLTYKLDAMGAVISYNANTYTWTPQILPTKLVKLNVTGGYALLGQYNNSNNNKTQFVAFYNSALSLLSFNELTVTYDQFTLTDIAAVNNGQDVIVNGNMYDNSKFYCAIMQLSNTGNIGWKHLSDGNTTTSIKNVQFDGIVAKGNSTVNVGAGFYEGAIVGIIDSTGNGLCNTLPFNVTNVPKTLTLESSVLSSFNGNAIASVATTVYTNIVSFSKKMYCGSLPNSIIEQNELENAISFYPNPADDMLQLKLNHALNGKTTVKILSLDGRVLYQHALSSDLRINTSGFATGFYIVSISDEKFVTNQKIEIIH